MEKKVKISIILLFVLHLVGMIGLSIEASRSYFLLLVPLNLVISAILLFYSHSDFNKFFAAFFFSIFNLGFAIEVLGVTSGKIFGVYQYTNVLGFSLYGVPVLIGLLWLCLVYSTGVIAQRIKAAMPIKAAVAALLMLILDFFMEPIAIKLSFWNWQDNHVPAMNYLAWFLIAFVFQIIFNLLPFEKSNKVALPYYLVLLGFFVLLNFSL